MTITEYRKERVAFFDKYEKAVRAWLLENGADAYLAANMPFFRDGIVNSEKWFDKSSVCRPLFILKEVNTGLKTKSVDEIPQLIDEYNKKWGLYESKEKYFEFVENKFDDIQVGKFSTWKKVVRLAIGLLASEDDDSYKDVDLNVVYGEEYIDDIKGYKEKPYKYRTANTNYIEAVNRIAVIDIKKIGAGGDVNSLISSMGKSYMCHLCKTSDYIVNQIEMIEPTVIICCCGHDSAEVKRLIYDKLNKRLKDRITWINSPHPGNSFQSDITFCEESVKKYREMLQKK